VIGTARNVAPPRAAGPGLDSRRSGPRQGRLHPPKAEKSTIEPKVLAALAARIADAKKGVDIRVFDVSEHIKVADYFVLVSGTSRPHVRAIQDEIHVRLKALSERHAPAEGAELGWWVLMDYGDVVVHVLQPEAREYYALDPLYGECPQLDWAAVPVPATSERAASQAV
jgi:ribosome-associated protein